MLSFVLVVIMILSSIPASALTVLSNDNINSIENTSEKEESEKLIVEEDTSKRGEFEKHFYCTDGSFVAVMYPEAIHYKDGEEWIDVDNTLTYNSTLNEYVSSNKNFNVSFSNSLGENKLISLKKNGYELSWTLETVSSGTPKENSIFLSNTNSIDSTTAKITVDNEKVSDKINSIRTEEEAFNLPKVTSKIKYSDAFGNNQKLDLDYTVYQNKVEEDIILTEKSDISSFVLRMNTNGLIAILNSDNSISFVDNKNEIKYTISIPYMCDAVDAVSHNIKVDIQQNGSNCVISYIPDKDWLNSADRVYPILLDPSITTNEYNAAITDTYVQQGDSLNHSSEQKFYVGIKSGNICRTYIKFSLPHIDSTMPINNAAFVITVPAGTTTGRTFGLYRCNSAWRVDEIAYDYCHGIIKL
ncbi:MAG: hypothetical protein A2Y17_06055 [Clostridiales bacterium GWF2_38_85]|nr:MAG: hypothetical protein A2Y17_06055 [Clostridiales bacterium GWF2_38_85]HBL85457.1 hypothetical protein [Clostridiales bacterium]